MKDALNQKEVILLALEDLTEPISASWLVVLSWQKNKELFGLDGYKDDYPDSNKVLSNIMGDKGLVNQGLLRRIEKKQYVITQAGKNRCRLLRGEETAEVKTNVITLRQERRYLLERLLDSEALRLYNTTSNALTFTAACRFWEISEKTKNVDEKLNNLGKELREIDELMFESTTTLPSGRHVDGGTVRVLKHLHSVMLDRFERHINLLSGRKLAGRV